MSQLTIEQFTTELEKSKDEIKGLISAGTDGKASAETVEALKGEFADLQKTINSVQEQVKNVQSKTVPGLKEELKKNPFSFTCAVRAMHAMAKGASFGNPVSEDKAWGSAGHELEIIKAYSTLRNKEVGVTKSNYSDDGSAGGYLIPPEVTNEVIDMVIANMPIMQLGPTVIKGLQGELPIPKKTTRSTSYWVGENTKPDASEVAYGETTLRPKKAAAFSKQSNRLIYQSRGVSDKIIKQDIAESIALLLEAGYINGSGSDKQPLGILNGTGFTSSGVALAGNRFRIDDAAKMISALDVADEYKPGGAYGLLVRPEVLWGMKRERVTQFSGQTAGQGAPIMAMNLLMTNEVLSQQLGIKIASTTLLPKDAGATTSKALFANWKHFYIGMWRDFVMKVSDVAGDGSTGSAFLQDQLYIVAFQEVDCAVMRPAAFTTASGCDTNEDNWAL